MSDVSAASVLLSRARLLLAQNRPDHAERILRQALGQEPDCPEAHTLLASALLALDRGAAALPEARQGVQLAPDEPFAHYVLCRALAAVNQEAAAERAVREAIRLDPEDPDYRALLSAVLIDRGRAAEALAAAEEGLRLDPEHVECINFRAAALVRLGRRGEAAVALDAALTRDPDNAFTHANRGWALLHGGRSAEALEHFREALRRDPQMAYARHGIIQALRARNPIYRVMLLYFLWMSRASGKARWAVLIGAYLVVRIVENLGRTQPALAPFAAALMLVYFVFFFLSWTAGPLFDLLLRLDRLGRRALTPDQIRASSWVGGLLLVGALLLAAGLLAGQRFLPIAALGGAVLMLIIPASATFQASRPWGWRILGVYTLLLTAMALGAFAAWFVLPGLLMPLTLGFILGWVLFALVANLDALRGGH